MRDPVSSIYVSDRLFDPTELLQGFPDAYVFHPSALKPISKAQLGKWIGDAVPMPLGHAAGLAVLGADPL